MERELTTEYTEVTEKAQRTETRSKTVLSNSSEAFFSVYSVPSVVNSDNEPLQAFYWFVAHCDSSRYPVPGSPILRRYSASLACRSSSSCQWGRSSFACVAPSG